MAVGVSLVKYKTLAFVLSAVFGGLAGAIFAPYMKFINPTTFGVDYSMNSILAIIMGGNGTIVGPIIGSFAMNFLPEYLRIMESLRLVVYGLILILITMFMPNGVVGILTGIYRKIEKRKQKIDSEGENE
jgi:branched-chain amino acid transport system permease protein